MNNSLVGANDSDYIQYLSEKAQYGLITVTEIEFLAIKYVLSGTEPLKIPSSFEDSPFEYWLFEQNNETKKRIQIICCKPLKQGNNSAAIAATRLLTEFRNIKAVFVCGIAAGMPVNLGNVGRCLTKSEMERHVCIGDVIIAEQGIFQYDLVSMKDENQISPKQIPLTTGSEFSAIISSLKRNLLEKEAPWFEYLTQGYKNKKCQWKVPNLSLSGFVPMYRDSNGRIIEVKHFQELPPRPEGFSLDKPYIHFGTIGSANILLRNFEFRDKLCTEYSNYKILAIEMEGSGVADAAWTFNKAFLVIRGACDYGDKRKVDDYQQYAAMSAAAVLKTLISRIH